MSPGARTLFRALRSLEPVRLDRLSGDERAAIEELERFGLDVSASSDGCITLSSDLDLLDRMRLESGLRGEPACAVEGLHLELVTGSTNVDALASAPPAPGGCRVWLAEYQSAGQGRRGKHWHSLFASGLCMSLAVRMPRGFEPGPLPLAIGMGIRYALMHMGVDQCQLKWPNDLVVAGRKLGGLLLGARQLPGGDTLVVAGLGINVHDAPPQVEKGALPSTALVRWLGASSADRTTVAIALINAMRRAASEYARTGFATFADDWPQADFLHQQEIVVLDDGRAASGVAQGIDLQGRLLVRTGAGVRALSGGDVSVRPVTVAEARS